MSSTIDLYEKQLKRYAVRTYPIFLRSLQSQVNPVVEYIRRTGNTNPPLDILVMPNVFIRPIQQSYEMVGMLAAKRQFYLMQGTENKAIIDFLIDAWRSVFLDYATNYAYQIDNELSETTKEEIRQALAEAYEQGLNADRTATYIREKVGRRISRSRAVLISRTESATAANLGKRTGAESWLTENNEKGYKQWIGRNDGRERTTHIQLNDDIIPMDNNFMVGNDKGQYPGDVNLSADERCNCRCTVIYMSERRYNRIISERKSKLNFVIENIL